MQRQQLKPFTTLMERSHDVNHRFSDRTMHWLQNEDHIVIDHARLSYCENAFVNEVFLDKNWEISIKKIFQSLPEFV